MTVDDATKELVRERANYLCEYCHSPERISANRFTVDHLLPKSIGGSDDTNNLALACRRCNERRYNFVAGFDSETEAIVALFNPRQQIWSQHFIWSANGRKIIGVTSTGRATCKRLDLNDERYPEDDSIQSARGFWVEARLHPPKEDARQSI